METDFKCKILQNFNEHFDQVEDSSHAIAIKEIQKSGTKKKAFGMVIYATKNFYANDPEIDAEGHLFDEDNKVEHINKVLEFLKHLCEFTYGLEVDQIILGHEHGDKNKKCHFQIIIELKTETQKVILPGEFWIGLRNYIFMAQKARNPHALKLYCKKDGDFYYLYPDKAVKYVYKKDKKGEPTDKIDAFATVVQNPNMDKEDKMALLLNHEPTKAITMYKNIEYAIDKITSEVIPDFQWSFPEYMVGNSFYNLFEDWFNNQCKPDGLDRRRGLVIYGERNCGKSRFARSLVNHPSYYIEFSGLFNQNALLGKTPKLLILDDINHYKEDNKESWKRLMVGQTTNINDKYTNIHWTYEIPCILVTNNKNLFTNMLMDLEFKTVCNFFSIPKGTYIGPPGTEPKGFDQVIASLDPEMQEFLEFRRQKREKFINDKEEGSLNFKRERSRDRERDDDYEKLKKENERLKNQIDSYRKFQLATRGAVISDLFNDK